MISTKQLNEGDKVLFNGEVKIVYAIYNEKEVSLCLDDYDDVEEDYLTDVKDLELIK
jgi:hypothetical protein